MLRVPVYVQLHYFMGVVDVAWWWVSMHKSSSSCLFDCFQTRLTSETGGLGQHAVHMHVHVHVCACD